MYSDFAPILIIAGIAGYECPACYICLFTVPVTIGI